MRRFMRFVFLAVLALTIYVVIGLVAVGNHHRTLGLAIIGVGSCFFWLLLMIGAVSNKAAPRPDVPDKASGAIW